MNWYCVSCKRVTESLDVKEVKTKNGQLTLRGNCSVCGKKKSTFLKKGAGIVNSLLNSSHLPEMHLPSYNYCGPGTKLKERMQRGDVAINELDKACQFHDLAYNVVKDPKERHIYDKKLEKEAWNIAKHPKTSVKNKLESGLVAGVMHSKRKLGMGQ